MSISRTSSDSTLSSHPGIDTAVFCRKRRRGGRRTATLLVLVGLSVAALCTTHSETSSADRPASFKPPRTQQKDSRLIGTEVLWGSDYSYVPSRRHERDWAPTL